MEPFIEHFDLTHYLNTLLCFMLALMASNLMELITQKDFNNEQH